MREANHEPPTKVQSVVPLCSVRDPGKEEQCAHDVVDAALRVHTRLGPGLLEGAYRACLAYELRRRARSAEAEVALPLVYDGVRLDLGYRVDLLVDGRVIVEVKAVAKLLPIHEAQLLSYLRLTGLRVGLLMNFHEVRLRDGIRRMVNG